ncbi:MAG: cupin domain-containing protein [Calditrichaeota bacterium]|nr:MAG: cupin domain-containing protein [Calditrichota bacterium]
MKPAGYWIDILKLQPHPEGGYYREIYRSNEIVKKEHLPERFNGDRCLATSIYFLLEGNDFSSFHRLKSDEIWNFYTGSSLTIYSIHPNGILTQIFLGDDYEAGEVFQAVVPAGCWFAARVNVSNSYSLVGCTVAPGFEFDDFELGKREQLLKQFPQHQQLIRQFTRG